MRYGQLGRSIGVAGLDQFDEAVVLVGGLGRNAGHFRLARIVEGHADSGVVDKQAPQRGHQEFIGSHLADNGVKPFVAHRALGRVALPDRAMEGPLTFPELLQLGERMKQRCKPRHPGIDHRRSKKEVSQRLVRHRKDLRAPVFVQRNVTFSLQLAQHLAQRRARDAVGFAKLGPVEIGPRLKDLRQNLPSQVCGTDRLFAACLGFHECSFSPYRSCLQAELGSVSLLWSRKIQVVDRENTLFKSIQQRERFRMVETREDVIRICDRIAIVNDGVLVQIGTPEVIVTRPADDHMAVSVVGISKLDPVTAARITQPLAASEKAQGPQVTCGLTVREPG